MHKWFRCIIYLCVCIVQENSCTLTHTHTHTHTHTCMHVHTHTHTHIHTHTHAYTHACMHTQTHTHMHACHTHVIWSATYTHAHMQRNSSAGRAFRPKSQVLYQCRFESLVLWGIFLPESTASADSLTVPPACSRMHQHRCAHEKSQTQAAMPYRCLDTWKYTAQTDRNG